MAICRSQPPAHAFSLFSSIFPLVTKAEEKAKEKAKKKAKEPILVFLVCRAWIGLGWGPRYLRRPPRQLSSVRHGSSRPRSGRRVGSGQSKRNPAKPRARWTLFYSQGKYKPG